MFNLIHSSCVLSKRWDWVDTGVSLGNAQVGAVGTVIGMRTGVSLDTAERAPEADSNTCDLAGLIPKGCTWMAL